MSDYMRRFCSQLDIKRRDVNACTEVADIAVPREGTTRYICTCSNAVHSVWMCIARLLECMVAVDAAEN